MSMRSTTYRTVTDKNKSGQCWLGMKGNYQLDKEEIFRNGSLEPVVATAVTEEVTEEVAKEAVVDVRPTVTNDEYVKLSELKGKQSQLKESGFDMNEFITSGQSQVDAAKVEFANVKETLSSTTKEFQDLFNEVTTRYGFSGNVTIEDSDPHYIYETVPATV